MPDSRQFQAVLTRSDDDGWAVTVPEVGRARIDDPALADFQARQLIQQHLGISQDEVDDLDLTLVDEQQRPVFVFDLLFTSHARGQPANDPAYRRLATDPPPGCRYETYGSTPGLHCVRHGPSRFQAIAALIAHVRDRYGLDADDLGFEKLWEWAGGREEREGLIAHLLLMAARRARWAGVPPTELIGFLQAVTTEPPS